MQIGAENQYIQFSGGELQFFRHERGQGHSLFGVPLRIHVPQVEGWIDEKVDVGQFNRDFAVFTVTGLCVLVFDLGIENDVVAEFVAGI